MSFTRSTQSAHGDNTPAATALGMTPADRFFDQPPEMSVLGPLGSFRVFGTLGNDFATENQFYSWTDNLSWVHGSHKTRAGGFFLSQTNWRDDAGAARGKLSFQTFDDFLLGLSADGTLSPSGRSNIQSVQASEGAGTRGQIQYNYRSYYGAAFLQNDFKASSRLTLNFGMRWEYVGPALDTTGAIGNAWPDLLRQAAIPPASGTLVGNTVAANYNPSLVNPYTGQPFGPPPSGVFERSTKSFYRNAAPLGTFAPRFGFAWQPLGAGGRLSVRGGYGLFYQTATYSANASGTPLFTSPPFAQGFTNADSSNNLSSLQQPFPTTTLGFVPRTPTSQLSDRVAGPDFTVPGLHQCGFEQHPLQPATAFPHHHARFRAAHAHLAALRSGGRPRFHRAAPSPMEHQRAVPPAARPHFRCRLRGKPGQPPAAGTRSQSTSSVDGWCGGHLRLRL